MSILIRPAAPGDEEILVEQLLAAYAFHASGSPDLFRVPEREFLADMLRREYLQHTVAEVDGAIAGLVQYSLESTGETPIKLARRFVAVATLQVAPNFRRRGVGRALMEYVHSWAAERDATHVDLNVYEFNEPARGLYDELGYTTVSRMLRRSV